MIGGKLMKKLLLASVACLALSFPVMAKSNQSGMSSQQTTGSSHQIRAQSQNGSQGQMAGNQQQAQVIEPASLNKTKIRQLQMKLNKAGYSAGSVDGIWGGKTRQALRNYQRQEKLPGNGQLNQQTLAQLGVNGGNQSQSSNRTAQSGEQTEHQTTGSASGHAAKASSSHRGSMNMEPNAQSEKGSGQSQRK
jgi:hypothetical protein